MKHLREYRHFKIDPSRNNIKDPNEPFFIEPKYDYKQKRLLGIENKKELIEIDIPTINNLIQNIAVESAAGTYQLSENLLTVLNKIRKYVESYYEDDRSDISESYLVFEELSDDDLRKLTKLGFGVYIYDDSNEYSEYFGDKHRISWEWK